MKKKNYGRPPIDYKKFRKSKTIPDQSLDIKEIVKRFVRGIPVDVIQRDAVYIDQSEHDLEQMSRMNFADKSAMADDLRVKAEQLKEEHNDRENDRKERAKEQATKKKAKQGAEPKPSSTLDITRLDDTSTKNSG